MQTTLHTLPVNGGVEGDIVAGERVGEYVVQELLGKGGFGTVYRAVHPVIGAQVAIKVLARKFSSDGDVVSRFIAEARAVNQIRHHNIIDIFAFSQLADGRHYYVMEYLDGETVERAIATRGAMTVAEALPILRGVARALDAAHAKGIAHRDLKPENILLAHDPEGHPLPKLLDFGIAKLLGQEESPHMHKTATGAPIGTPYCMSPEQCRGRDVDHRTDIYSFGILAYRMLTARYPFEGADYIELLFKQVNDEPPPPSSIVGELPREIDDAIAWMMRKLPDDRPATAMAAVQAIDPTATTQPSIPPGRRLSAIPKHGVSAFGETLVAPATRTPKRWLVLGGVVVAACAGFAIVRSTTSTPSSTATAVVVPDAARAAVPIVPAPPPIDAAIEPSHIVLTISAVPTTTTVWLGNTKLGSASDPIQVPRGPDLELTFKADGHKPRRKLVSASGNSDVSITLDPLTRAPSRPPKTSRDTTIEEDFFDKDRPR